MEAFTISTLVVTLAEIGDKTQLLAFVLATRFRKPAPIILGILLATLLNHGLAGSLGSYLSQFLTPQVLRWVLAASFLGMAVWTLIPDQADELGDKPGLGVFTATFVSFFLAEVGDKTQLATLALGAHYAVAHSLPLAVIAGTTLGMLIADVPAVFIGQKLAHKIPLPLVRRVAAGLFLLLAAGSAWDGWRMAT